MHTFKTVTQYSNPLPSILLAAQFKYVDFTFKIHDVIYVNRHRHFQTQDFGNGIRITLRGFDGHQPGPYSFKNENGCSMVLQNADVDVTDDPFFRNQIRGTLGV
jgi:hypothetical protein